MKTCVVSTDRDAFQLVSENVCLMMTPRGVADVQVYTPERVEARYGIRPDQIPDFIGLKGDTSDNIPGIPGIGDKTAGQLISQYGSLEEVVEHASELSPARSKAIAENAEQARASKLLATMRRDLDLGVDSAGLVLQPPDRSELKEIFRRFEFRGAARPRRHARRGAAGARSGPLAELRDRLLAREGRARRICAAGWASPPTAERDRGARPRPVRSSSHRPKQQLVTSRCAAARAGSAKLQVVTSAHVAVRARREAAAARRACRRGHDARSRT